MDIIILIFSGLVTGWSVSKSKAFLVSDLFFSILGMLCGYALFFNIVKSWTVGFLLTLAFAVATIHIARSLQHFPKSQNHKVAFR